MRRNQPSPFGDHQTCLSRPQCQFGAVHPQCKSPLGIRRRFREAVQAGALPFGVQGTENGLAIEGGRTLAFEMAEAFATTGKTPDAVYVQVGGGALASALATANDGNTLTIQGTSGGDTFISGAAGINVNADDDGDADGKVLVGSKYDNVSDTVAWVARQPSSASRSPGDGRHGSVSLTS